jgi:GT2 family glycosyltransferase
MFLNIVVPVHNEVSNLTELLPHLNKIKAKHSVEVTVVISKTSDDGSFELCRDLGVNVLQSQSTQRSSQMNEGAKSISSEYVMFLHADAFPPIDLYEKINGAVLENYKVGMFSYKFRTNNPLLKVNESTTSRKNIFTGGGDQGLFIENKLFEELGTFDDHYVIMEDFALFKKISELKIPYTIVIGPLLVSDRKYQKNSYVRVNLVNFWALVKFKLGHNPQSIKSFYKKYLKG